MAAWLVKTEPSVFSIEDLRRERSTRWDLVRNYQARNFLCAMKPGERVAIYHSNDPAGVGVVGIAEVSKVAYPDPSQFDKKSEYFDPKATVEKPRWFSPELRFVERLSRTVTLQELAESPLFKAHQLTARGNRLSVLPLTDAQLAGVLKLARRADAVGISKKK
jgi:predicted RNA-binding protein with PUA-like domain